MQAMDATVVSVEKTEGGGSMKWFKHLSGSLNNSLIYELVSEHGSDGYLVFFGTIELMSDEFDIYNPGLNRIPIKKMQKSFQMSRHLLFF